MYKLVFGRKDGKRLNGETHIVGKVIKNHVTGYFTDGGEAYERLVDNMVYGNECIIEFAVPHSDAMKRIRKSMKRLAEQNGIYYKLSGGEKI